MCYEDEPDSSSPIDKYLQVAAQVISLGGYMIIGEITIGGYEHVGDEGFLSVYFTDERSGLMITHIPVPQEGSGEI